MIVAKLLHAGVVWLGLGIGDVVRAQSEFNNPPGVDVWCGKAYRATNSSFDPGGQINAPTPNVSREPRISVLVYPQYSYYTPIDQTATFIISTPVSNDSGTYPFKNWTYDGSKRIPLTELKFWMSNVQTGEVLLDWVKVPVNASEVQVDVNLDGMRENGTTSLSVVANSEDGIQTFYSTSEISILPERNDTGSMTRIDRLHGGLQVRSSLTNGTWTPIFPFSFYTSWDWIRSTMDNATAPKNLSTFRALGYNIIHPVPPGGTDPFDATLFEAFLRICDDLHLYLMYDMRHTYQNNTSISAQLARLQAHPSLLLYYTADEPDGWCDPLNATSIAYQHIQQIDPYHPVSLVLNCANFHFAEYTAGADILLEDTYPLVKSSSYSPVYHTVCNSSYGDCGCDNCHVDDPAFPDYVLNPFLDISERVDSLYRFQDWIQTPTRLFRKPVWGVPQAFFDAESFWRRWPTAREEAVMALLRVNHGVKGVVSWIYPTSAELERVTSKLAAALARPDITALLLTAPRSRLHVTGPAGSGREKVLDGAAWTGTDCMLIIVLHLGSESLVGESIRVVLPDRVEGDWEVLFGFSDWKLDGRSMSLWTEGLGPLDVSILKARIGRE